MYAHIGSTTVLNTVVYTRSGETELVDSFISSCRPWPIQIKVEEPPYKLYKYMYAIRMEIYEPEQ